MYRATTPTHTFTLPMDTSNCLEILVTYKQGNVQLDKHYQGNITHVTYKEVVVDANLSVGGYGIKKEYEIPPQPELQYLELATVREGNNSRYLIVTCVLIQFDIVWGFFVARYDTSSAAKN